MVKENYNFVFKNMFDDPSLSKSGTVPNNLPVGEPEDIFAGASEPEPVNSGEVVEADMPAALKDEPMPMPSTALGAGVLRPRETTPPSAMMPPMAPAAPTMQSPVNPLMTAQYEVKKPSFIKELIFAILIVGAIVSAAGGAWWFYKNKFSSPSSDDTSSISGSTDASTIENSGSTDNPTPTNPPVVPPTNSVTPDQTNEATKKDIVDDKVLFGEPIDSDADGLDDTREQSLGTDPKNWDSDTDGLSDGDEINIWKTDPKNSDSDGDTFKDGDEVKNGYNPKGPGKLFEPPKAATTTK